MSKLDVNSGELIGLAEAAEIIGKSHDHMRRLAQQGKLKSMKIGRNWVTTKQAAEEYLAQGNKPGRKPKKSNPSN